MGKATVPTIEDILEQATRAGGQAGRAQVERAYVRAQHAHDGQKRETGEPYITHCLAVASILSDLNLDPDAIAAALLHDVVEDTDVSLEQLQGEFGRQVAYMVDGVTKLARFDDPTNDLKQDNVDRLRKLFVSLIEGEVRIALIKLADRLHNMRTLAVLSEERQQRLARETMEIFAPLASLLGIWQMKGELEDLAFAYLYPEQHGIIVQKIAKREADREEHIARIIERMKERLELEGIPAEVHGRAKHVYSIYRKMQRKHVSFEDIFDVRAVRVIVEGVSQCYQSLGIIHGMWRPIPGEFDDYIATPKNNMYRSLHTAVLDEDGIALEVQIRTTDMHREAEYGVAAHWKYKEGGRHDQDYVKKIACLRARMDWRPDRDGSLAEAVTTDLFQDRIYAFTPKGGLVDLPLGSTPIDFAYHIHTEVGHRCRGARVNGKLVNLDYQLQSGDRVEILTAKQGGPSRDWLNPHLGFIKAARTRAKIKRWFKQQNRAQSMAEGRAVLERELKRAGVSGMNYESIAKAFGHDDVDCFFVAIGQGDINTHQLVTKIIELDRAGQPAPPASSVPVPPSLHAVASGALVVCGTEGLLTNIGRCCNPLPGDDIIGYVTRGRGVTVHRQDCPNILRVTESERLIDVSWGPAEQTYPVMIKITAYNRSGLLRDISAVIANHKISMSSVSSSVEKNIATLYATLQVSSIAQLSRVLTKLQRVRNVLEVRRQTS